MPDWGNVVFESVSLFVKDSRRWISLPSRKDNQGKYWSYIRFEKAEDKSAFDHAVLAAFDDRVKKETLMPETMPDFLEEYM